MKRFVLSASFAFVLGFGASSCGGCDETSGNANNGSSNNITDTNNGNGSNNERGSNNGEHSNNGDGSNNGGSNNGGTTGPNNGGTNNPNSNTGTGRAMCNGRPCACDDGIDNDGDGLIDGQDPECTGPYDDDESSFATGIPGDNIDFCQDCFFDGNSGMGDDGCAYHTECLYGNEPPGPGQADCFNCDVSDQCLNTCRPLTPNGCDCFGCCEVQHPNSGDAVFIFIGAGNCTIDQLDDPDACTQCVQSTQCVNECGRCELCAGKTAADLPADCETSTVGGGGSGGDGETCVVNGDCVGAVCQSGTCEGDGSGGDGDPCTVDGDCVGAMQCDAGTCSGGGASHTCDDGEVVCNTSQDCPNNHYCQSGCCIYVPG